MASRVHRNNSEGRLISGSLNWCVHFWVFFSVILYLLKFFGDF